MDFDLDVKRNKKRMKRKRIIRDILTTLLGMLFMVAAAYLIITYALEKTNMLGNSMNVTLNDNESILINKMIYRFTTPKRYDVIVFKQSTSEHSYYNIKRVIALPGETVEIINGEVYVNHEPLEEPFQFDLMILPGLADEPIVLDEDEYFVLGDNRNQSEDSRYANIGNVTANEIIGKAWIRTKPLAFIDKIGIK